MSKATDELRALGQAYREDWSDFDGRHHYRIPNPADPYPNPWTLTFTKTGGAGGWPVEEWAGGGDDPLKLMDWGIGYANGTLERNGLPTTPNKT